MFNIQPGQGLGFGASKEIGLGLGTPFTIGVTVAWVDTWDTKFVDADDVWVPHTLVGLILDTVYGDEVIGIAAESLIADLGLSTDIAAVVAVESLILSDSAVGSDLCVVEVDLPSVEEPVPVIIPRPALTAGGWGDIGRPLYEYLIYRYVSSGSMGYFTGETEYRVEYALRKFIALSGGMLPLNFGGITRHYFEEELLKARPVVSADFNLDLAGGSASRAGYRHFGEGIIRSYLTGSSGARLVSPARKEDEELLELLMALEI